MENIIVYVDDASHALHTLRPLLPTGRRAQALRWIVVGCAPRVTHHVSKFVTHSTRDSWRRKWSDKVFSQVVPALHQDGDDVVTLLAQGNLLVQTEALINAHGAAQVIDARRPRFGQDLPPVTSAEAPQMQGVLRHAAGY